MRVEFNIPLTWPLPPSFRWYLQLAAVHGYSGNVSWHRMDEVGTRFPKNFIAGIFVWYPCCSSLLFTISSTSPSGGREWGHGANSWSLWLCQSSCRKHRHDLGVHSRPVRCRWEVHDDEPFPGERIPTWRLLPRKHQRGYWRTFQALSTWWRMVQGALWGQLDQHTPNVPVVAKLSHNKRFWLEVRVPSRCLASWLFGTASVHLRPFAASVPACKGLFKSSKQLRFQERTQSVHPDTCLGYDWRLGQEPGLKHHESFVS